MKYVDFTVRVKDADFTANLKASVLQGEGEGSCTKCGSAFELSLRAISRAGPKMKKMADHKELSVYKAGDDLALEVFKLGKDLQKEYKSFLPFR